MATAKQLKQLEAKYEITKHDFARMDDKQRKAALTAVRLSRRSCTTCGGHLGRRGCPRHGWGGLTTKALDHESAEAFHTRGSRVRDVETIQFSSARHKREAREANAKAAKLLARGAVKTAKWLFS